MLGGPLNCRWRGPAGAEGFSHHSFSFSTVLYITFFTLEMHEHMLTYCVIFILLGAPGKSVPTRVLELPSTESKLNWANSGPGSHGTMLPHMVHTTVYVSAKSSYCCFSKGKLIIHKEIIKSVAMLSHARRRYINVLSMNVLQKWYYVNTNNKLRWAQGAQSKMSPWRGHSTWWWKPATQLLSISLTQ